MKCEPTALVFGREFLVNPNFKRVKILDLEFRYKMVAYIHFDFLSFYKVRSPASQAYGGTISFNVKFNLTVI